MKNDFENKIDHLIAAINKSKKGIGWKNFPNRTHDGKYIEGEKFDYIILSENYKCCFDAKMSISDKYKIMKKDIKQAHNLLMTYRAGLDSFFLIYFKSIKNYKVIRVTDFFILLEQRKYITPDDCSNLKLERMIT